MLHERLLAGDELATAQIAETFIPVLLKALEAIFPRLSDPHLATTAVNDALINYFKRPEQFDPNRSTLFKYLRMSARSDLLNSLRRKKIVELTSFDSEHVFEGLKDSTNIEASMLTGDSPLLREVDDLLKSPADRQVVRLMIEGVRETSEYAGVLGILDQPQDEQARIVKRHKDRLKKTLQRKMKRVRDEG
jgi:RNA polymerase sigma-70 factor, ECF subfamily